MFPIFQALKLCCYRLQCCRYHRAYSKLIIHSSMQYNPHLIPFSLGNIRNENSTLDCQLCHAIKISLNYYYQIEQLTLRDNLYVQFDRIVRVPRIRIRAQYFRRRSTIFVCHPLEFWWHFHRSILLKGYTRSHWTNKYYCWYCRMIYCIGVLVTINMHFF